MREVCRALRCEIAVRVAWSRLEAERAEICFAGRVEVKGDVSVAFERVGHRPRGETGPEGGGVVSFALQESDYL